MNSQEIALQVAVALALLAASSVWAQQPSQEEINARLQALVAQRNEAQNRLAMMMAAEAVARAEIDRLKKQNEGCKEKKD